MRIHSEKRQCVVCHLHTALVPLQAAGIPSEWRPCCTNSSHPIKQVTSIYSSATGHINNN